MEINETLQLMITKIDALAQGQEELKQDVNGLKQDVNGLKIEVGGLKQEVDKINFKLETVIEPKLVALELKLENTIEPKLTSLDLKLENIIEPKIQLVYENQLQIIKSDTRLTTIEEDVERNTDDIVVLNVAVKKHTSDIELLKAN